MAEHNLLGKLGEEKAFQFLLAKGFKILCRNWRYRKAEMDLVAVKDGMLVIVEVKTRSSVDFELPQEAVGIKKQKQIILAANAYIEENNIDMQCRFDVVSVLIIGEKVEIEHIEDAFAPLL